MNTTYKNKYCPKELAGKIIYYWLWEVCFFVYSVIYYCMWWRYSANNWTKAINPLGIILFCIRLLKVKNSSLRTFETLQTFYFVFKCFNSTLVQINSVWWCTSIFKKLFIISEIKVFIQWSAESQETNLFFHLRKIFSEVSLFLGS